MEHQIHPLIPQPALRSSGFGEVDEFSDLWTLRHRRSLRFLPKREWLAKWDGPEPKSIAHLSPPRRQGAQTE